MWVHMLLIDIIVLIGTLLLVQIWLVGSHKRLITPHVLIIDEKPGVQVLWFANLW